MKVVQVNYSDIDGGAGRAAYRIHHALRRYGVDSRMYVSSASAGDWTVQTIGGRWTKQFSKFRQPLAGLLTKAFGTENRFFFHPPFSPRVGHNG